MNYSITSILSISLISNYFCYLSFTPSSISFIAKFLPLIFIFKFKFNFKSFFSVLLFIYLFLFIPIYSFILCAFYSYNLKSFLFSPTFSLCIIFAYILYHQRSCSNSIRNSIYYFGVFITFINTISLFCIYFNILDSSYLRYTAGLITTEHNGLYITTNYATYFSSIGFFCCYSRFSKKHNIFTFLFVVINFISIIIYHSRCQTILFLFFIILYYLFNNRKILFLLIMFAILTFVTYYNTILSIIQLFLKFDVLIERGILGNRSILYNYFYSAIDLYSIHGIGFGNCRLLWDFIPNDGSLNYYNASGLNPHSSLFKNFIELGFNSIFLWLVYVFILIYCNFSKIFSYNIFYFMLLYLVTDGLLNDHIAMPGSPGTLLLIILLVFFYNENFSKISKKILYC